MARAKYTPPTEGNVRSSKLVFDKDWGDNRVVVVSGYLEEPQHKTELKPKDWRWRLYRTLELQEYLEFKWDSVAHIVGQVVEDPTGTFTPAVEDPLQPVVIWFYSTARVALGDFLVGDVAASYLPLADMAAELGQGDVNNVLFRRHSGAGCSRNPACGE